MFARLSEAVAKTFVVLPAGVLAPIAGFAQNLARALNEIAPTRHITKDVVEQVVGKGDMNSNVVVQWLNDQEAQFEYLVYETDLVLSDWTSRCICPSLPPARGRPLRGPQRSQRD